MATRPDERMIEPEMNPQDLWLEEIFTDLITPLGVPAWQGAMIGHQQPQWTLPEGVQVEIDADQGTIRMLEPAVS